MADRQGFDSDDGPNTPESSITDSFDGEVLHPVTYQGSYAGPRRKQLYEPSPASTTGKTAAGDSTPVTPQGSSRNDTVATVYQGSARSVHMTPLLSSGEVRIHDFAHINSSRGPFDRSKFGSHPKHELFDPSRVEYESVGRKSSENSPAKSGRNRQSNGPNSPATGSPSFVVVGNGHNVEDPFVSDNSPRKKPRSGTPEKLRLERPETRHGRQDHSKTTNFESPTRSSSTRQGVQIGSPSDLRSIEPISARNAQAVLPPSACVFVANLSTTRSDEELEHSVADVFRQFGVVYVKIRRDNRGMPYAFCQYEREEDAQRAIVNGRRLLVDGRPCRTEPAKVNRSLYMSRLMGGMILEEEARHTLEQIGPVESCWWSTQTERELYHLPEGIWVKFAYFQDCRDAQSAFRDDNVYRLEQPHASTDDSRRGRSQVRSSPRSRVFVDNRTPPLRSSRNTEGMIWPKENGNRAEIDNRSVFVGNLPHGVTKEVMTRIFSEYGNVVNVDIIVKPALAHTGVNVFAFVEYAEADQVTRAIHGAHAMLVQGSRIRVQRKEAPDPLSRNAQAAARFPAAPITGNCLPAATAAPERFTSGANTSNSYAQSAYDTLMDQLRIATMHIETQRQTISHLATTNAQAMAQAAMPLGQNMALMSEAGLHNQQAFQYGPQAYGAPYAQSQQSVNGQGQMASVPLQQQGHYAQGTSDYDTTSGVSPGHSIFGPSPQAGYYSFGHDPSLAAAAMGQSSTPGMASGTTPYHSGQQYPAPMGQFQYPGYPPVAYYQYQSQVPAVGTSQSTSYEVPTESAPGRPVPSGPVIASSHKDENRKAR